jgi:3-dehydroquinate synthetase
LFRLLASEPQPASTAPAHTHIARAAAVKVGIVNADPLEHGERARLNLGHTIGHGVETASGYALRHGEAVSIGAVAEAHVAEMMGLAERGLAEEIANCLAHAGLPVRCTGLEPDRIRTAMGSDKKKAGGKLKFALPRRVGEVEWGVEVDERLLMNALRRMTSDG